MPSYNARAERKPVAGIDSFGFPPDCHLSPLDSIASITRCMTVSTSQCHIITISCDNKDCNLITESHAQA